MSKKPISSQELEAPSQDFEAKIAELENELSETQALLETEKSAVLRALAAKENIEKRLQKQLGDAHAYALLNFSKDLLPIFDSLDKACELTEHADEVTKEGMEMTRTLFEQTLNKYHIECLNPLHETFDPQWHEAIATEQDEHHDGQVVLKVMQTGYRLKERLLRPALVVVNQKS